MLSRRLLRIKVLKALFAHMQSGADSMSLSEKELIASVDMAYDLYFQMLLLPVAIADYGRNRLELARNKKLPTYEDLHPNTRFVDNRLIRLIADSDSVNDPAAARKLGWTNHPELIRTLYNQLTESDYYREYMQQPEATFEEDCRLLIRFFESMQECPALDEVLEEFSIQWCDDLPYIVVMVMRTLENTRKSHTQLKVAPKFKSEDDPAFLRTLFERTLVLYERHRQFIEQIAAHWDVERLVFMDNLIIATAMTELVTFPSIPVKVTLDEFIEISKYYSTPGSSTFINGILDKAVDRLTEEGAIAKAGRGLI